MKLLMCKDNMRRNGCHFRSVSSARKCGMRLQKFRLDFVKKCRFADCREDSKVSCPLFALFVHTSPCLDSFHGIALQWTAHNSLRNGTNYSIETKRCWEIFLIKIWRTSECTACATEHSGVDAFVHSRLH